jgi:capsular polysaccharide export protein
MPPIGIHFSTPFFRVPAFPHVRHQLLMRPSPGSTIDLSDKQVDELMETVASARVGASFWGEQPALPAAPYTLVRVRDAGIQKDLLNELDADRTLTVNPHCDPWHVVSGADQVVVDADDELALVAGLSGLSVRCIGKGPFRGLDSAGHERSTLRDIFRAQLDRFDFIDPFSNEVTTPSDVVELCSFWRSLIDSNRDIAGAFGFAKWKRSTVEPLLWAGSTPVFYNYWKKDASRKQSLAIWRSRVGASKLAELDQTEFQCTEVEDGFIRSVGLGADCIPPLSIVVDRRGIYFDPGQESDLEHLLQNGSFLPDLLVRARRVRDLIVGHGLSKYEASGSTLPGPLYPPGSILVPGQVEDDRSIVCGGGDVKSNLELLRRVRADAPTSHIIYKPHPDVEAGHRIGAISDDVCLTLADEIVRNVPITVLISAVDEVHVNTSLAGFEALLRDKRVTTHGVPFYAGWGLTRDLGAVPARRTARRSLDELVAAALLLYPRYVDPVTGLPCPPEVVIDRLANGAGESTEGILVPLRRLQGRLKRYLSAFQLKLS